jgi:hypothetical protein
MSPDVILGHIPEGHFGGLRTGSPFPLFEAVYLL